MPPGNRGSRKHTHAIARAHPRIRRSPSATVVVQPDMHPLGVRRINIVISHFRFPCYRLPSFRWTPPRNSAPPAPEWYTLFAICTVLQKSSRATALDKAATNLSSVQGIEVQPVVEIEVQVTMCIGIRVHKK